MTTYAVLMLFTCQQNKTKRTEISTEIGVKTGEERRKWGNFSPQFQNISHIHKVSPIFFISL